MAFLVLALIYRLRDMAVLVQNPFSHIYIWLLIFG